MVTMSAVGRARYECRGVGLCAATTRIVDLLHGVMSVAMPANVGLRCPVFVVAAVWGLFLVGFVFVGLVVMSVVANASTSLGMSTVMVSMALPILKVGGVPAFIVMLIVPMGPWRFVMMVAVSHVSRLWDKRAHIHRRRRLMAQVVGCQ